MRLSRFDDWLTNQDRWYGMDDEPTKDQIISWQQASGYYDDTDTDDDWDDDCDDYEDE